MVAAQDRPKNWPSNYGTGVLVDWQFATAAETQIPPYAAKSPRRSGPQGKVEPFTVVEDPAAWYSKQWQTDKSWIYELTEQDIAELDGAIHKVERRGLQIEEVTKEDFFLPSLAPRLIAIGKEVSHGRGFHVVRGVPVMRYTEEQCLLAAWGLGLYWGNHQVQDKLGQLISHVQAKSGGLSTWSSQITAHNEMLLRGRQDLVEVLTDGQWWLHKEGWNCQGGDLSSYYNHPVFSYHDGYLSCSLQGAFYFKSQSNSAVPKITAKEIEALSLYTALSMSDDLRMEMHLQPGDFQLLHNCSMCHTRGHFVNGETADEVRHLLRVWIASKDERPLPDVFKWQWGSTTVGDRGGWHVPLGKGLAPHVPLKAGPPTFT